MVIPRKLKLSPFKIGCLTILAARLVFYTFGNQKPALLIALDNRVADAMFRWRGPEKTTGSVVIIDIDEKSLQEIGQWPWPRNIVARLIRRILAEEPRVIGLDIVFAEQDRTSPSRYVAELQKIFYIKLPSLKNLAVDPDILNHDLALGRAVTSGLTILGYAFQLYAFLKVRWPTIATKSLTGPRMSLQGCTAIIHPGFMRFICIE
jgi:adenylate cyclase